MNIFKALSQGDGTINETNVTSFLSYVFNETTEFSSSFLFLFLEQIDKELNKNGLGNIIEISDRSYRERINNFKNKYSYSAIPENPIRKNGKTQDVDILITISEKNSDNDCCYLLLENKIKKSAFKEKQCLEQYLLFNENEDFQLDVPIFSILITPDIEIFKPMIERVKESNSHSVWLKWESSNETSIIALFKHLLKLERTSEISPIDYNTQYILRSFIDYLSTKLSTKENSISFSISGSEIVDQAEFQINGQTFSLKRYDNKMIRIFDENEEMVKDSVKPKLREIISKYKLNIDLNRNAEKMKNTQRLGKDVIQELNKKITQQK